MIIIGTFAHSIELEQALSQFEKLGIARRQLLVVCMDSQSKQSPEEQLSPEGSSSANGVEVGLATGTALSVIGTCVGFNLSWGPIIWGLITAIIGFFLGFGIHAMVRKPLERLPKVNPEVTVIVQCPEDQFERVRNVMWKHRALSVGRADASTE